MGNTKLIIIRGPSGAGKSTVSKIIFDNAEHKIALIEQDYYRFIFKPYGEGGAPNSGTIHKMLKSDILFALADGYNVIVEGILGVKSYAGILDDIFAVHPNNNYMYYFDISFEETVRRHATRKITRGAPFGEKDMREWYPMAHKSNHILERIIPESFSAEDIANKILLETGL